MNRPMEISSGLTSEAALVRPWAVVSNHRPQSTFDWGPVAGAVADDVEDVGIAVAALPAPAVDALADPSYFIFCVRYWQKLLSSLCYVRTSTFPLVPPGWH